MASPEPAPIKQRCAVHPERASVGACQDCGRASCLACSIPFRTRLLCRSCAARALGSPGPQETHRQRPSPRPEVLAGGLLIVGLASTIAPWHRSGPLTGRFSAWNPAAEVPVLVAVVALAVGAILALGAASVGRPSRGLAGVLALLSGLAAGSAVFSLLRAPDFYAFSVVPYVVLTTATATAVICITRTVRLRSGVGPQVP